MRLCEASYCYPSLSQSSFSRPLVNFLLLELRACYVSAAAADLDAAAALSCNEMILSRDSLGASSS